MLLLVAFLGRPAAADPVPGIQLFLSRAASGLADVTVFSVSMGGFAGKPKSVSLVAYMTPEPLQRVAPTSMYLAIAARKACGSGWALVRMFRDDLPWTSIRPAAPQGYSKIADAAFDPDRISSSEGSYIFAATRLATPAEVQQSEMFDDQVRAYRAKGVDDARAERNAVRDIKKKFAISGNWYIPPGNTRKPTDVGTASIADDVPREIVEAIRPLCAGYEALPSR